MQAESVSVQVCSTATMKTNVSISNSFSSVHMKVKTKCMNCTMEKQEKENSLFLSEIATTKSSDTLNAMKSHGIHLIQKYL